jgi:hypothetical protein
MYIDGYVKSSKIRFMRKDHYIFFEAHIQNKYVPFYATQALSKKQLLWWSSDPTIYSSILFYFFICVGLYELTAISWRTKE